MDTNDFLSSSYPELAELLTGRLSATPEPRPLNVSPWIAQSLLQKSIRRGETGHALSAAATLLRDDPDKLWRRLTVAVFEDVGLGSLDLIAPVLIATSGKGVRGAFGGDWIVASAIIERMASGRKDRSADDAFMVAISHHQYESDRLGLTYRTLPELMSIATGADDTITRSIALIYAIGTNRCPLPTFRSRRGHPGYAFQRMLEEGFPHCVLELSERGSTRFREPLPALMSLLSRDVPARSTGYVPSEVDDDIAPTIMIGDVPSWCVDFYTRPGRVAMKVFLKRDTATGSWIRNNVALRDRVDCLGALVFRVEGGLLRRRLQWPTGEYLRKVMEVEAVGFGVDDASEVLDLLRNDLPLLNDERRHVL